MSQQPQQPQTINISDLDVAQLADIKKQLEDVSYVSLVTINPADCLILLCVGAQPSHFLLCATQASTGQVQGLH
jgi:hypothetical protein